MTVTARIDPVPQDAEPRRWDWRITVKRESDGAERQVFISGGRALAEQVARTITAELAS